MATAARLPPRQRHKMFGSMSSSSDHPAVILWSLCPTRVSSFSTATREASRERIREEVAQSTGAPRPILTRSWRF